MRNEINDGHEKSSLVFTRSTFEGLRETPAPFKRLCSVPFSASLPPASIDFRVDGLELALAARNCP